MLTESQKQILHIDEYQNIAILCLEEEYPLLEVMQEGSMLMCRFKSDEEWCHFSHNASTDFIDSFFRQHTQGQYVVISDPEVFNYVCQQYKIAWSISCKRLFLDNSIDLTMPQGLLPIRQEHLQKVYDYSKYQQFLSKDYLLKRLEYGGGFCIEQDGLQAAWVMTHDDGSIGMLQVVDEYRGRGFARMLINAMAIKVRQKGRPVFAHIEPGNKPSLNLFGSLGFEVKGQLTWARIE